MNKLKSIKNWLVPFIMMLFYNITQVNAGCGDGYNTASFHPIVAYDKCTGVLTINQFKYYERNSGDPDDKANYLYVDMWINGDYVNVWKLERGSRFIVPYTGAVNLNEEEQDYWYGNPSTSVTFGFARTDVNIANWWRFANLTASNIPQSVINSGQIKLRLRGSIQRCGGGNHNEFNREYTIDVQDISAPSGLTATTNNCNNVVLSWQNPSQFWHSTANCAANGIYNIDIYRNNTLITSVAAGTTSYTDNTTTLDASTDYTYKLLTRYRPSGTSTYQIYSGFSNNATGSWQDPPPTVNGFTATTANCNGSITLNWQWNLANPANGFKIERATSSGGPYTVLEANLTGSARSYVNNSTTPSGATVAKGVTYYYRISATDNCNRTSSPISVTGIAPDVPAAPTITSVTSNTTNNTITVNWTDNSNNETFFRVIRNPIGAGGSSTFDVDANVTSFVDNTAASCINYQYIVKAHNDCSTNGVSSTGNFTAYLQPNLSGTFTTSKFLKVSKGYYSDRVMLEWSNNNGPQLTSFRIYRKQAGSTNDSTLINTVSAGSGVYVDATALANVLYKYTVIGETTCAGNQIYSNATEDIGFRSPFGLVNGRITYSGGVAVKDVKVTVSSTSAASGSSLLFTGNATPSNVSVSDKLDIDTGFSVEFWARPININTGDKQFVGVRNGSNQAVDIYHNGTTLYCSIKNASNTTRTITVSNAISANNYSQITFTMRQDQMVVYVNGILRGSLSLASFSFLPMVNCGLELGKSYNGNLDELRMWGHYKDSNLVKRDFSRFVAPDESGLKGYWSFDENIPGLFRFFDQSKLGILFNENNGTLHSSVQWSNIIPGNSLLSNSSYTDENGDYLITNVRYTGAGQTFTVVPNFSSAGISHAFTPTSNAIFLGEGSSVLNSINFTNTSSFTFSGRVIFAKGDNCPSEGVAIKIDGNPVLQNGELVTTDEQGEFTIQVPIGPHVVTVEKANHIFSVGRFPRTGAYEFLNPESGVVFRDSTLVKVVGRVVGGLRELRKAPGLGRSKNNIGVAQITFSNRPSGIGCMEETIYTNASTGEYTIYLPPMQYFIRELKVPSDLSKILTAASLGNPTGIDISGIPALKTVVDTLRVDTLIRIDSVKYHERLDFKYLVEPEIFVTNSTTAPYTTINNFTGEAKVNIEGTDIPLANNPFGYPIFVQDKIYEAKINIIENYFNRDGGLNKKDSVPASGTLNILANNIASESERSRSGIRVDSGYAFYSFRTGAPNLSTNGAYSYTSTIEISFAPEVGSTVTWNPNRTDLISSLFRGYVLGARSGGATFTTTGPATVDLILRDPPGSASYASWQSGRSLTKTSSWSISNGEEIGVEATLVLGTKITTGVGLGAFVTNEAEIKNSQSLGLTQTYSKSTSGELVETISNTTTITTGGDPMRVGAGADIFYGKATNLIFGLSDNLKLMDTATCRIRAAQNGNVPVCYGNEINGHKLGLSKGFFMVPGDVKTTFVYTAKEIEETVIPGLIGLRNQLLLTNATNNRGLIRYKSNFNNTNDPDYDLKFASNNDDPIWGNQRSSANPFTLETGDSSGQSYSFRPDSIFEVDSIRYFNNQIRLWKNALARNEKEKYEAFKDTASLSAAQARNISIGEASIQQDFTTQVDKSESEEVELQFSPSVSRQMGSTFNGFGLMFNGSITYNRTDGKSSSETNTTTNTISYYLQDGDQGDLISVDIVDGKLGNGHIFRLRAGQTSCPYEGETRAKYYDPDNDTIMATTHLENGPLISAATARREVPDIGIRPTALYNVPAKESGVFTLELRNLSESRQDMTYALRVNEASNPNGAIIKVDGLDPNRNFNVPYGATSQKTLTVERGPNHFDYNNIQLILESTCDETIFDTISFSISYIPTCTEVAFLAPGDRWVLNNKLKDTLATAIGGYNYNFGGLKSIEYQFKPAAEASWSNIAKFYKDTTGVTDQGVKRLIPLGKSYIDYNWITKGVADGNYEIRAVSECAAPGNPKVFVYSPVFQGIIDRQNPEVFGTPSPGDGILDPNDDISIQFNEPIDNSSLTKGNFDVRGVLNGSDVQTNTSLYFDANNDYIELPTGINLINKPFTIELMAKRGTLNTEQCLVSQGVDANQNIWFGFDAANRLVFKVGNETVTSNTPQTNTTTFSNYAISFNPTTNTALLYVNGNVVNIGSVNLFNDYMGSGKMLVGRSSTGSHRSYNGNLLELRVWNVARTTAQIQSNLTTTLNGREVGILGNWRIDEAEGNAVKEIIRARHGNVVGATWQITPLGRSYSFNGNTTRVVTTTSNMAITKENDFTIEFWVKSNQTAAATLLSNGKGDGTDDTRDITWNIYKTSNGALMLNHNGNTYALVDTGLFDATWHHVALVMQRNSNFSTYLDGNLQKTYLTSAFNEFSGPRLSVGARTWLNGTVVNYDQYFNGNIDEVRFWNIAKTQELVKRDRLNRLLGNEPGLKLYLPFELYAIDPTGLAILSPSLTDIADSSHVTTSTDTGMFSIQTPTIKLPRPVKSISFSYVVNNDKIIITPSSEPKEIENVTLDITVSGVRDLRGNLMQSPKTWIAFINKNQVKWLDDELTFEKQSLAPLTFKSTIINSGGALKTYNLQNIPQWLSANQPTGTIAPNSSREITFTVNPNVNIGSYEEAIGLITDFGYSEKLVIKLKVFAPEPNWTVDASKFQNSMSVIGQMRIGNVISSNTDNILAAFVNGECRGKGKLQYFENIDRYLVFLDIYGDSTAPVIFKIWNAAEGKMHDEVTPELTFIANDLRGSISAPVIFNADDKLLRTIPLNNGWNWVSFNLSMRDSNNFNKLLNNLKLDGGEILRSQTQSSDYNIGQGWLGTLSSPFAGVKPNFSYRLKSIGIDTLTISGVEIDPSYAPVPLVTGWNWIGFVSQRNLNTNEAFANHTATHGDLIKSQNSFAVYDSILGWIGSLQALRPNVGYMYYAQANGQFVYPRSAMFGKNTIEAEHSVSKRWKPDYFAYQNNMSVVAKVSTCLNLQNSGELLLGAYVNNELRGVAKAQKTGNDFFYYLTIAGDESDSKITFKLLNESNGKSYLCNESHSFASNTVLGKTSQAVLLSTAAQVDCSSGQNIEQGFKVTLYPNPTVATVDVKLAIELPQDDEVTITVYDMNGKIVTSYQTNKLNKGYQLLPVFNEGDITISTGVYFVKVNTSTHNTHIKLIKQ